MKKRETLRLIIHKRFDSLLERFSFAFAVNAKPPGNVKATEKLVFLELITLLFVFSPALSVADWVEISLN